jgi:hypothetical protein
MIETDLQSLGRQEKGLMQVDLALKNVKAKTKKFIEETILKNGGK